MQNSAQGWHVAEWGLWGRVETIFKVIALIAGIAAFFASNSANSLTIGSNPHLAAAVLLALLMLLSLVALTIRFQQKEIISLIFGIVNFLRDCLLTYITTDLHLSFALIPSQPPRIRGRWRVSAGRDS